jgi:hypothetical protein
MKINVLHILEGIKNSVFVNAEVEKIATERYAICRACPAISTNQDKPEMNPNPGPYFKKIRPDEHCTHCACNIHAKIRSLHTACPIDRWPSVASIQEAAKIAAALDKDMKD